MTGADEKFQAKLKALRDDYKANLDARLDEIDAALDNLQTVDDGKAEELDTLLALAHKLSGSAGTFGLHTVSNAAETLETLCASLTEEEKDASAELERIAGLVHDLRKAAEEESG